MRKNMFNKKIILILTIFIVSLFAISAVSAVDNATSDVISVEETTDDVVSVEIVIDNNLELTQEEVVSTTHAVNGKTFEDIQKTVDGANDDDTIELSGNYAGSGTVINITKKLNIVGRGETILDAKGSSGIFKINSDNITVQNLKLINANNDFAIDSNIVGTYWFYEFQCINCTFKNNLNGATYGATSVNCTFINNHGDDGGAVSDGSAFNCIFINNSAKSLGGAIYNGDAENCIFINNSANRGGAIAYCWQSVNCSFFNNSAKSYGGAVYDGQVMNCTLVNNSAYIGGAISYCEATNSTFINNTAYAGGAIGDGWDVINSIFYNNSAKFGSAMYQANPINCTFLGDSVDLSVLVDNTGGTGYDLKYLFDDALEGDTIELSGYYSEVSDIVIDKALTIIGVGETIIDAQNGPLSIVIDSNDVTLANIKFINSYSNENSFWKDLTYCGVIRSSGDRLLLENCSFINNQAFAVGAIDVGGDDSIIRNCIFKNNKATMDFSEKLNYTNYKYYYDSDGYKHTQSVSIKYNECAGAIRWTGDYGLLDGCIFSDNSGYCDDYNLIGRDIRIIVPIMFNVSEVTKYYGGFEKYEVSLTKNYNPLSNEYVNITVNGKTQSIKTDSDGKASIELDLGVGTYDVTSVHGTASTTSKVTVKSTITTDDVEGYYLNSKVSAAFLNVDGKALASKQVAFKINGKEYAATTDAKGVATANVDLGVGNYDVIAVNPVNSEQKQFKLVIDKANSAISLASSQNNGVTTLTAILTPAAATGNVVFNVNGEEKSAAIKNGKATLTLSDLNPGEYNVTASYSGDKNLNASTSSTVTFNVPEVYPILTADPVTKTYGTSTKLVVNLADSKGNAIADADVSVVIGSATTHIKTDSNGQATMAINKAPGTYTATITYADAQTTAKINVKKATPKLTAKAKTFKKSLKTKKYTVTLKTNTNKVMKNTKVTLKVNGKTYKATTNTKGQATFKITKLTKKGKFTAVVKYAGSKYYNAKTVKPKITVK